MTTEYTCIKDKTFWETEYSNEMKEMFFMKPHHQHRPVAKISSCWVYAISTKGIVQLGSFFIST